MESWFHARAPTFITETNLKPVHETSPVCISPTRKLRLREAREFAQGHGKDMAGQEPMLTPSGPPSSPSRSETCFLFAITLIQRAKAKKIWRKNNIMSCCGKFCGGKPSGWKAKGDVCMGASLDRRCSMKCEAWVKENTMGRNTGSIPGSRYGKCKGPVTGQSLAETRNRGASTAGVRWAREKCGISCGCVVVSSPSLGANKKSKWITAHI